VRGRTDREWRGDYGVRMKTLPLDLKLAVHVTAGDTYEWSKVLLARANLDGTLEFLTAAWERVLGYSRYEFKGKTLCQLMGSDNRAAARAVAAILDERSMAPVDLTLHCRGGKSRALRLHRRLDAYTRSVFIVAEET
jgi:PAS domain-containing protein